MNKATIISGKAAREILNASFWYDKQLPGLSQRFIKELDYYFEKIGKHPELYKKVDHNVHRCLMKMFPYIIFFSKVNDNIIILRVRHKKQKPVKRYK